MVKPGTEDEDESPLDNAWTEDDGEEKTEEIQEDDEEVDKSEDGIDGEAEIATADVHEHNVTVEEGVGEIGSTSTSDLSDAEIDDEDAPTNDEEVEVETAELEEEDVKSDSGKFGFDETEDANEEVDEDDERGSASGLGGVDDGGQIADDINSGVASLGVIGIEDEETQEDLREDFYRTARDFRLGYYGEECVQEYFLSDGKDEVSPVWGLVFASIVCAAIFAFRRPDTEQLGGKVSDAIGNIGEGLGGESS